METKSPIRPISLTWLSAIVMAHAVVTDHEQLRLILGPDVPVEDQVVGHNGQPITLIDLSAWTSGSPPTALQDALRYALARRL